MPSKKVRDALSSSVIPNWAVELLGEIPDGGVHCVGTWSTLPSDLRQLAKSSELLANRLHCEPKDGGFVKLNRWKALLGGKFGSFQDCIPKSHAPSSWTPCVTSYVLSSTTMTTVFWWYWIGGQCFMWSVTKEETSAIPNLQPTRLCRSCQTSEEC